LDTESHGGHHPPQFSEIDPVVYITRALEELRSKSLVEIQIETALVWCGRACAAARLGIHRDSDEYAHEAIAHAALSGDDALLKYIRGLFAQYGVMV